MKRSFVLGLMAALGSTSAMAVDITIPDSQGVGDGQFGSAGNPNGGAYNGTLVGVGTAGEDQEVSAGAVANQSWDYEAFTLTGSSLGIIAGFDMRTGIGQINGFGSVSAVGVGTGGYHTDQGDIFINVGTRVDARDGTSSPFPDGDGFDFDYVIKFNSISEAVNGVSYSVYSAAQVTPIPETSSSEINPGAALLTGYLYKVTPNTGVSALYSGTAGYLADQTSAQVGGYVGTYHDVMSGINLDYSKLPLLLPNSDVFLYTTMGCGNDIMEGKFTVPDGGMTLALLGVGFLGVGALRRRSA